MKKLKQILLATLVGLIVMNPVWVLAQTTSSTINVTEYQGVDNSITNFLCTPSEGAADSHALEKCINKMYRFGISFGAIALVFFLVFAGYMYIMGGESGKTKAKGIFQNALIGIGLLLGSYVILSFINPSLVLIKPIQPPIFGAADLPKCLDVGFDKNCVVDSIEPGSDVTTDYPFTGSYKACGRTMTDITAEAKNQVDITVKTWDVSGSSKVSKDKSVKVHKCIAERTKKVFEAIYNDPGKFPIATIAGWNVRPIANTDKASPHSFGVTLDINAWSNCHAGAGGDCKPDPRRNDKPPTGDPYPWVWKPCPGSGCNLFSIPDNGVVVKAFKDQGFGWGGNWRTSKDYMHFSCVETEQGKCPEGPAASTDKTPGSGTTATTTKKDDVKSLDTVAGLDGMDEEDMEPFEEWGDIDIDGQSCEDTRASLMLHLVFGKPLIPTASAQECDGNSTAVTDPSACGYIFKTQAEAKAQQKQITIKTYDTDNEDLDVYANGQAKYYVRTINTSFHKCLADQYAGVFSEFFNYTYGEQNRYVLPIYTIAGFNWRPISGKNKISYHGFGVSADINASSNCDLKRSTARSSWVCATGRFWRPCNISTPYTLTSYSKQGYPARTTSTSDLGQNGSCSQWSIPPENRLVEIMRSNGFSWGGRWRGGTFVNHLDFMHFSGGKGEWGALY